MAIAVGQTTDEVLVDIRKERERQVQLLEAGKIPYDIADPYGNDFIKLSVLLEEFGEVSRNLNEDLTDDNLYEEIIQICAIATAWAESIK